MTLIPQRRESTAPRHHRFSENISSHRISKVKIEMDAKRKKIYTMVSVVTIDFQKISPPTGSMDLQGEDGDGR